MIRYILLCILFVFVSESMSRSDFKLFSALCMAFLVAEVVGLRRRLKKIEKEMSADLTVSPPSIETEPDPTPSSSPIESMSHPKTPSTSTIHARWTPTSQPHAVSKAQTKPQRDTTATLTEKATKKERKAPPLSDFQEKTAEYLSRAKAFFTTGNLVLKIGIIVIFFGVSFLLKYAAQRNMVPIEFRLMGVFAAGLITLFIGWRLRHQPDNRYGLALQGAGLGILYLTVFATTRLYALLPTTLSMGVMLLLVLFSALLALLQDAKSLAIFSITGGFLSPVLISTGSGSHVTLFSYYAILNGGILAIAWFKAWRKLNLLGFAFTFVLSTLWASRYYRPIHFAGVEPFLILFFLFYVTISILFAHRQPVKLKGFIDGPLVFGVPLICFTFQGLLVKEMPFGLALTALGMGLFYATLATLLWRRAILGLVMLTEAFLAMGVVFGSIAIPMALDARWTSAAWALEGGAMVWVGIRQQRLLARFFGLLLQLGSGMALFISTPYVSFQWLNNNLLSHFPHDGDLRFAVHGLQTASNTAGSHDLWRTLDHTLFLNPIYIGAFFIAVAGLFSSYCYWIFRESKGISRRIKEHRFHFLLMIWGVVWWYGAGFFDIIRFLSDQFRCQSLLLFSTISVVLMSAVAIRLGWQILKQVQAIFLPIMVLLVPVTLFDLFGQSHLFNGMGLFVWSAAFGVQYGVLWCFEGVWDSRNSDADEKGKEKQKRFHRQHRPFFQRLAMVPYHHMITLWLMMFVISHEGVWVVGQFLPPVDFSPLWADLFWGIIPAGWIWVLTTKGPALFPWPVRKHTDLYLGHGVMMPSLFLVGWFSFMNFNEGNATPLPYIPLMNPLEISQIFILFVLGHVLFNGQVIQDRFLKSAGLPSSHLPRHVAIWGMAILLFIWINFLTGRIIHHYADIGFTWHALSRSVIFHAAISILWSITALGITVWATKTHRRSVWLCGATLLGLVVLKLFTVDLSGSRTLARIISFLAVGTLMLIIGYFSPLPPVSRENVSDNEKKRILNGTE